MAGGAAEAVGPRGNLPATEKLPVKGLDPAGQTMIHRKSQSKVKVAVVQPAVPVNADLMPAHQTGDIRRVEGILRRWSYEGETVLPDDPAPYYRVSVRCGFSTPEAFREALAQWRKAIREVYLKVFSF